MKKVVLCFLLFCLGHLMMAQGHMTFKGVEIDGSLSDMVAKLASKGFTYIGAEEDVALMSGDFAGYRDCQIAVLAMQETGMVNAIGVVFANREEWSSIEGDYDKLKSMLTEKYGKPSRVIEEFQHGYVPDNWFKFHCLVSDQCTWASVFETPNGTIELFMQKVDYRRACVILKYYDKANSDVVRAAAMDDL